MKNLDWKDSYNIFHDEIDNQHKKLFSIFNNLVKALKENKSENIIQFTLTNLLDYSNYHFADEELFMQEENNKHITHHIANRTIFIDQIKEFKKLEVEGDPELASKIYTFLNDWISHHIAVESKSIAQTNLKEK